MTTVEEPGFSEMCTFAVLKKSFYISDKCEITLEANPGTIDKKGLKYLKESGFNRLSIGLQSADDLMLKTLGRIHSFEDFCDLTNLQVQQ